MAAYKKILLIQLRQLGDILLTTPCIRELKTELAGVHITFLSHRMGRAFLEGNPYIDELLTYHESDTVAVQLQRLRYLRKQRFDLVIDFMNNPRSALFTWATAAPQRVSFRQRLLASYNRLFPAPAEEDYIVRTKFSLLNHLGFSPKNEQLLLPWSEQDMKPYYMLCAQEEQFARSPLRVVLSPTHRREHRKWPALRYVRLAERLVNEWGASVTWIWGPGSEEQEIDQLISQCGVKTFKSPPTTLRELTALLAQHDVFIGNSNGPSHIAVAADICSLQLHGHTNARSWCPQTSRHRSIQSSEFGRSEAPTLEPISEEQVWSHLLAMKDTIVHHAQRRK